MATTAQHASPHRSSSSGMVFALIAIAGLSLLVVGWAVSTYNALITGDQDVRSRWAQVENAYQRRADLVPNLVETVKGAAAFETKTFTEVTEARAQVGQVSGKELAGVLEDPKAFERFQAAQQTLGASLQRLLAVSEAYPDLKATANFRDLQSQLEGTENRIAIERMRFNEAARDFNTLRSRFPAMFVARSFGDRFAARPYFEAAPEAKKAPAVRF
ncbi:MAG: LemA family protein [Archangium sp.]|nr:LemA family protein [Archangium sp.]